MLSLLLPLNCQLLINCCYSSASLFSTTVNVILRVFSFAKSASKHDLRSITDCVLAMSSMPVICLLIVTFLITITGLSAANKNYPLRTIQHVCCNGHEFQLWSSQHSNCQSLDSVLSELLPNNSVLELTNGSCNLTHSLNFTRVSNITIRGQSYWAIVHWAQSPVIGSCCVGCSIAEIRVHYSKHAVLSSVDNFCWPQKDQW